MKKVGIITHYYNSCNYGGNLQAYALVKIINDNFSNCDAEQICYTISNPLIGNKSLSFSIILKKIFRKIIFKINKVIYKKEYEKIDIRKKAVLKFNKNIRHSNVAYNDDNIKNSNDIYDIFITGSDQVWHPNVFSNGYLLNFVSDNKIKLSYAASIAKTELNDNEQRILLNSINSFNGISVREESALKILKNNEANLVLDPTLLLSKNKWDEISSSKLIKEKYLFCYFLGDSKLNREFANKFAKEKELKIVTLPYLLGNVRKNDMKFGDIQLFDVSPSDFISLIKYADFIFTDSFHATVFSHIYNKEFFAFNRDENDNSQTRIINLLELIDLKDRFIEGYSLQEIDCILNTSNINKKRELKKYENLMKSSIEFLTQFLGEK